MKKLLIVLFSALLTCCLFTSVSANSIKIIDEADLLTSQEEETLTKAINDFIDYTGYDMVIYFANKRSDYFDEGNDAITRLADDTFDYKGYGLGNDKDGLILCCDFYYRDYTITTHGRDCIDTYSDKALESIYKKLTPIFANNNAYDGALAFVDAATYAYDNYDSFHDNKIMKAIIPSLIISGIITLISFIVLLSKLKSKHVQKTADYYMKNSAFNIVRNRDVYLYSQFSKTPISRNNSNHSSGSSSSTHISSSGQTHGGGGSHKF